LFPRWIGCSWPCAQPGKSRRRSGYFGPCHDNHPRTVTRQQHADLFLSTILEGPHDWPVRPVAEIAYERDFGRIETKSALVGAIWQVKDDLAVDIALRGARVNDHSACEIRAGVTFAFAVR